jgi:hypothetical protein
MHSRSQAGHSEEEAAWAPEVTAPRNSVSRPLGCGSQESVHPCCRRELPPTRQDMPAKHLVPNTAAEGWDRGLCRETTQRGANTQTLGFTLKPCEKKPLYLLLEGNRRDSVTMESSPHRPALQRGLSVPLTLGNSVRKGGRSVNLRAGISAPTEQC